MCRIFKIIAGRGSCVDSERVFPISLQWCLHTLLVCPVFWFRRNNSNVCNSRLLLHMHFNIYIEAEKVLWIRSDSSNFCHYPVLFWLDFFLFCFGVFLPLCHFFSLLSTITALVPLGNSMMPHIPDKSVPFLFCGWLILVIWLKVV